MQCTCMDSVVAKISFQMEMRHCRRYFCLSTGYHQRRGGAEAGPGSRARGDTLAQASQWNVDTPPQVATCAHMQAHVTGRRALHQPGPGARCQGDVKQREHPLLADTPGRPDTTPPPTLGI